jgi:sphingomyelin phosphodiesterase acid-like 3
LNTVLFSVKYENISPSNTNCDPAQKELEWLAEELKSAAEKNEKVWLLLHIPVGVNVYSTLHKFLDDSGRLTDVLPFWKPQYSRQFLTLTDIYSQIIKAMFAGHTHMDTFRITKSTYPEVDPSCFIHVSPAISPQFGNNPGYEIFTYDKRDFTLTDYEVRYLNLENPAVGIDSPWVIEYSFSEAYQVASISSRSLNKLWAKFANSPDIRFLWMKYFNVSHTRVPGITNKDWKGYWLGMGKLLKEDYLRYFNR